MTGRQAPPRNALDCARSVSPGGDAYVACGSEDGRILFWDLVSGKLAHTLHGAPNLPACLPMLLPPPVLLSSRPICLSYQKGKAEDQLGGS